MDSALTFLRYCRSPRAGEDQAPAAAGPSNNKRARRSPVTVASRHQDRGADDSVLAVVDGSKTVFSKEERFGLGHPYIRNANA